MVNIDSNKAFKYRLLLALTTAALFGFYLLPLPGDVRFYLFAVYPVLGSLAAWWIIKIRGWEGHLFFEKYRLIPIVAALGLGGALAGLPAAIMEVPAQLDQLALDQELHPVDYRDDGLREFLLVCTTIMGCGQCFWLLWPAAAFIAMGRNHPKLVAFGQTVQVLIAIYGTIALIPYANMILLIYSFIAVFLLMGLAGLLFGWLLP